MSDKSLVVSVLKYPDEHGADDWYKAIRIADIEHQAMELLQRIVKNGWKVSEYEQALALLAEHSEAIAALPQTPAPPSAERT